MPSEELAQLRVYLEHEGQRYLSVGLTAERTAETRAGEFEVYVSNFHEVLAGRDSVHASGQNITRTTLVDSKIYEWRTRVAGINRLVRISGMAFGRFTKTGTESPAFQKANGRSGRTDEFRRSAFVSAPDYPHGYEIFAIPAGQSDLIERLRSTPPYPRSIVAAVVAADWLSPMLAIVTWVGTELPYTATQWRHEESNSTRFAVSPAAYRDTWVQDRLRSHDDDVLLLGPYRGPWLNGRTVDPTAYNFVRDADGEMAKVAIIETKNAADLPPEYLRALRARYPEAFPSSAN